MRTELQELRIVFGRFKEAGTDPGYGIEGAKAIVAEAIRRVTAKGIAPNPDWSKPETLARVRAYLGPSGLWRREPGPYKPTGNPRGRRRVRREYEDSRDRHLDTKYGMTKADYAEMRKEQGGSCAICTKPCKKMVVDHDHVTGQIRGLLCMGCNSAIGKLGDTPEGVQRAVDYLVRGKASTRIAKKPERVTVDERFDVKWTRDDVTGCWLWQSSIGKGGPEFDNKSAARYAYVRAHGYIHSHLIVTRTCDSVTCVNPDHGQPMTRAQHGQSKRQHTHLPYKGIRRAGTKWVARIEVGGKEKRLGTFASPEAAAAAYDAAAVLLVGECAVTNASLGLLDSEHAHSGTHW